jgi:hypothetical protein
MSSDTLVLKIVENDNYNREVLRVYVFYDHKLDTYGIRGGYNTTNTRRFAKFSFYCDSLCNVTEYLHMLFDKFDGLTVALVNYPDLPIDSNDITYHLLKDYDVRINETVGYDYTGKEPVIYRRYLSILKNVYNDNQETC